MEKFEWKPTKRFCLSVFWPLWAFVAFRSRNRVIVCGWHNCNSQYSVGRARWEKLQKRVATIFRKTESCIFLKPNLYQQLWGVSGPQYPRYLNITSDVCTAKGEMILIFAHLTYSVWGFNGLLLVYYMTIKKKTISCYSGEQSSFIYLIKINKIGDFRNYFSFL